MQFKALIFAAVASVAVAQSTATTSSVRSTGTSACAAQNILDSCIGTIKGQVNACATTDYSCLCTQYENMLTCYASCPNDPGVGTVQQQRELNCNNASVYGSTTTLGTAPATSSSTATATGSDDSTETGFSSGSGTSSGSSAEETSSSNGASGLTAGGVMAVAAAGIVAML